MAISSYIINILLVCIINTLTIVVINYLLGYYLIQDIDGITLSDNLILNILTPLLLIIFISILSLLLKAYFANGPKPFNKFLFNLAFIVFIQLFILLCFDFFITYIIDNSLSQIFARYMMKISKTVNESEKIEEAFELYNKLPFLTQNFFSHAIVILLSAIFSLIINWKAVKGNT